MQKHIVISVVVTLLTSLSINANAQKADAAARQQRAELGRQHDSAESLYNYLKNNAGGGKPLAWDNLPDWSGIYTRNAPILFNFDFEQGTNRLPTAKLTPEYEKMLLDKLDRLDKDIEFDALSNCEPPGHPRWLTEPFLREHIVTPDQTWLINEMVNDIRRIYTDGREHIDEADRYPLYNGDSIGFWDGHRLIIHTNQLTSGQYQRTQPNYSEQVETVEIWEKVDDVTIEVSVWVYDPPALLEPWFVVHSYAKLTDPDNYLRIRYWHCGENQNNDVVETEEGNSQFNDFDFTPIDDD